MPVKKDDVRSYKNITNENNSKSLEQILSSEFNCCLATKELFGAGGGGLDAKVCKPGTGTGTHTSHYFTIHVNIILT
jgi:hypothetical protein